MAHSRVPGSNPGGPNFEALEVTMIYFTFSETSNFFPFVQEMSETAVKAKNDL